MNNRMQTIRVGLFFLLGLALLWVTFESLNGGRVFKQKGYTLIARFDNLKGLQDGDDVLMAGVRIGAVAQTRLAGRQAEAVLRIEPDDHRLPATPSPWWPNPASSAPTISRSPSARPTCRAWNPAP